MAQVHPTAVIEGELDAADDVAIGPQCVLTGRISLGPGTRLHGHVYLKGPLAIGANNIIYPFACIGFAPQHLDADPARSGPGTSIGNGNTFREHVTVHRAHTDEGPTTIGDRNYFMAACHVGHDCRIGHDNVIVNNAMIAGHVVLEDRVTLGGNCAIHQHVHVGRGAMVSGMGGATLNIAPWCLITGVNYCGSVNLVGLRRSGASREDIEDVRWAYRIICREHHLPAAALERLRERAGRPMIDPYIRFLETTRRGVCTARVRSTRVHDVS